MEKEKSKIKPMAVAVNLPYIVCVHIMGEKHSQSHRMLAGLCFMIVGVCIGECFAEIFIIGIFCKAWGGIIHAAGTLPFIEKVSSKITQEIKVN